MRFFQIFSPRTISVWFESTRMILYRFWVYLYVKKITVHFRPFQERGNKPDQLLPMEFDGRPPIRPLLHACVGKEDGHVYYASRTLHSSGGAGGSPAHAGRVQPNAIAAFPKQPNGITPWPGGHPYAWTLVKQGSGEGSGEGSGDGSGNRKEGERKRAREPEGKRECEHVKMRRCEDVKMSRCEDEKMWRWEDVKMWRWEDVRMWGCEDEKMWRWEDVKMSRCEDEKMWRWEDVKMSRCEDEKMWRCEDVKMWGCEDEKTWRFEDVMWRCEDVKMFDRPPLLEEAFAQTLSGKKRAPNI